MSDTAGWRQQILKTPKTSCAGTRDSGENTSKIKSPPRVLEGAAQILGSGESTAKKKSVIEESSMCSADTRKREKYDQNKESSRSAEKILGSRESTAKIKKVYNLTPI